MALEGRSEAPESVPGTSSCGTEEWRNMMSRASLLCSDRLAPFSEDGLSNLPFAGPKSGGL